jgi:hypothetical protein
MARGFPLIRTEPDHKRPGANVFLFRKSSELEAAITEYCSK